PSWRAATGSDRRGPRPPVATAASSRAASTGGTRSSSTPIPHIAEGIVGLQKKIAYRLLTLREKTGLSQQEVADRADLSLSLIAKMEQGRKADPRASTLLALAKALGVRAGELIEDLTKPPEGVFPKKKGKKKK